jgi:hypothetical protein
MKGLAVLLCALAGGGLFAQAPQALVQELRGTVEVRLSEDSPWVPATPEMRLEQSAVISTGLQSSAVILIGQSRILVRPLTRLTIEELSGLRDTEQVGLFLRTGKIRAEVTPPENGRTNFTVRSPQAVNSVRGTVFEFDTVHLTVEEGRVWFVPSIGGSAALVRAGEASAYIEAAVLVSPPYAIVEALRPELPPGTENGAAMPESTATVSPPPALVQTGIAIGW